MALRVHHDLQLFIVEVDSMGVVHVFTDQVALLHQLNRSNTVHLNAEVVLIGGFTEVGVQAYSVFTSQGGGFFHQVFGYREGTTGSQGNFVHRIRGTIVEATDRVLTVGKDLLLGLNNRIRGKPAVFL